MILESAQMLSTCHHELGNGDNPNLYKSTHVNHPANVWLRSCHANYDWTLDLFKSLCAEYTDRYGKVHKSFIKCSEAFAKPPPKLVEKCASTYSQHGKCCDVPQPQCMPDEYKCDDPVEAYRMYYAGEKRYIAEWNHTHVPHWFPQYVRRAINVR